ncbi:hypothetical protein MIDIC_100004 [Alphaproteobacteria bacterium]
MIAMFIPVVLNVVGFSYVVFRSYSNIKSHGFQNALLYKCASLVTFSGAKVLWDKFFPENTPDQNCLAEIGNLVAHKNSTMILSCSVDAMREFIKSGLSVQDTH